MTVKLALDTHDLQRLSENTDVDFSKVIEKVKERKGYVKAIRLSTIDAICKALGRTPDEIFTFIDDSED